MTTAAPDIAARPGSPWIARPWIDLLVGCGGWSLPVLATAYAAPEGAALAWSGTFYSLALVANYPHYMATIYRAYGRADVLAHRVWTIYATAALVALGAVAHVRPALLPWLFSAYVMWSPWHYTGQNFGLLMMFLRRGRAAPTEPERRRLRVAFVASYLMLLVAFNAGPSSDPLVLSLGLPVAVARAASGAAALFFVAAGLSAFFTLRKRVTPAALLAPAVLFTTQGLWFVAPTMVSWLTGLDVPQTRYSSGLLAVMHAFQYLWITQYFARREQGAQWSASRYWIAVVAGGIALFVPIPWVASYAGHVDFTASMLIVASVVNLHHFMLDGVVWKLRDARVGRALTAADAGAEAAPVQARRRLAWTPARVAAAVAVVGLIVLAGVDQWRYRLASRTADAASLDAALRLNPFDEVSQWRLLQALVDAGREEEAWARVESLVAARPGDVNVLVNAGVLAGRTRRVDDAVRYWERALAADADQPQVELYLADLLAGAGRPREAAPHYQRHLELVVAHRESRPPDPAAIVSVVLRFGDALAAAGDAGQARIQFDLAQRMAHQTRLEALEAEARLRLARLGS